MNEKPILRKRKNCTKIRTCQKVLDEGLYSGQEKVCGRPVTAPNHFLCNRCLRDAESVEQALGNRR